ncbi:uncharacterized protein LOC128868483 [Anastrepha ludens]|uniref:uncharacterized protein LOC128868483 n=1 Tax=Anastrepha ludens TaxID=28586 RepID=UPI0023B118C1|nr:uncharacterized protein LOC128868483 [Anastrepha ludens]XP_053966590.1 uncharacterized protein LOC128868483 [Anastrepha ludens]XP_053966591.1 uncharacterized protein LOC128868483 [Anastrepha ludens]XP_053966592.1 uncharacterized protein LOC128868483 [Anastrepha ludens]XP_053966593.1 uncharacterized protein LOC128868483 [Anastrepha ludens]XP_053966594.1 uncharacterized protein LOC128868483 [Anastrepha ludens]
MFYSLVQTIVCVLLIQGGLYALHLNGPSGGSSSISSSGNGAGVANSIGGVGVNAPTNLGGSGAAQLNTAANTNQMLNILSASQYAQHLHAGGSGSGSGSGGGGGGVGLSGSGTGSGSLSHAFSKSAVAPLDNAGRLTQELADMAQHERERLMLLGVAKQNAVAHAGTGHHGRPFITGRIQMSPVEDVESDYPSLLLQQPRGPMYGSVVKQPAVVEDEYADEEGAYESDRLNYDARGRPEHYEYGRIVQPSDREEYGQLQRADELDELVEAEPEIDDMLTDLDSYQYLDELLPLEHRSVWGDEPLAYGVAGGNTRPHHLNDGFPLLLNPYRTLEELEESPPHTLQELFEKEQHSGGAKEHRAQVQQQANEQQQHQQHHQTLQQQQQQQQHIFNGGIKHRNGGYGAAPSGSAAGYNTHLQQKWQRKRSQQQQHQRQLQQWQRNIFGQQLHHFGAQNQRHSKLSLANSEATATKHTQPNSSNNNKLPSALIAMAPQQQSSSTSLLSPNGAVIKSEQQQQQQQQDQKQQSKQQQAATPNADDVASSTGALAKAAAKLKAQQQHKQLQTPTQKQESFLHPNHKRSGSGNSKSATAAAAANNGYSSIASQLMLRTARGQRQYDVPQIGKCKH